MKILNIIIDIKIKKIKLIKSKKMSSSSPISPNQEDFAKSNQNYSPSLLQTPTTKYKDSVLKTPVPLELAHPAKEESSFKTLSLESLKLFSKEKISEEEDDSSSDNLSVIDTNEHSSIFVNEVVGGSMFPILDLLKSHSQD